MMQQTDTPRIWVDDTEETTEGQETALVTQPEIVEQAIVPTYAEQKEILEAEKGNMDEESLQVLSTVVNMAKVSNVLAKVGYNESLDQRKAYLDAVCTTFLDKRFQNNIQAESLRRALLERLLANVENLDLQVTAQIYTDLQQTMSVDAQQALSMAQLSSSANLGGSAGPTVNVNLATGEGSSMNVNTLNTTPQHVQQLKEVAGMNNSIRAWGNAPLPKREG